MYIWPGIMNYFTWYCCLFNIYHFLLAIPSFKISGYSRSGIPDVTVGFENGVSHQMVLEPYSNSPCNFIGKLSNDPSSSVAVTGCLNQPGDKMHITLLSGIQSRSLIYSLDFDGQVTALENPTKYQTGMSTIHSFYGIKVSYFVQNYFQYRMSICIFIL